MTINNEKLPLKGVKCLEWTQAGLGPMSGKIFADFGAEVIKIESTKHPDMLRSTLPYKDNVPEFDHTPFFTHFNTGKKSFTLDLDNPRGKEIFKELVKWADIVLQNQRPGLMKSKGLGYEELKAVKQDIILVDISIVGQDGPYAGCGGWGSNSMAITGQLYLYSYENGEPFTPGFTATTDIIGAIYAGITALAALDYRNRTGEGQHLDCAQLESVVHFISPGILDYTINKRLQKPMGNRDAHAAPHNAFRCKGDDKWCAIAVFTEEEWKNFCKVLGHLDWIESPEFATFSDRKRNEDKLEMLINEWTINYSPKQVMEKMQEAGVPAGIVQNAEDIVDFDPHVKARELFPKRTHPVMGEFLHARWPFILSKTPGEIRTSPCIGEHNESICREILNTSTDEFIELLNSEVII